MQTVWERLISTAFLLCQISLFQALLADSLDRFILNGLLHANDILGEQVFDLYDWKVVGEYVFDSEGGRHQAFYSPLRDIRYRDIQFKAGERIQVEQSLKFSAEEAARLWKISGLHEVGRWSASSDAYSK
jgi:L-histidine Nalpha-methyltransferase / hercynylcysteine S-oxide synthase